MQSQLRLEAGYTLQGFTHALNIVNFPEDYKNIELHISAVRYLNQYRQMDNRCPSVAKLRQITENIANTTENNNDIVNFAEVADIFQDEKMIDRLRRLEEKKEEKKETKIRKIHSVYDDSQNVHNSSINKCVIKASEYLYDIFSERYKGYRSEALQEIRVVLNDMFFAEKILINNTLDYFSKNIAIFKQKFCTLDIFLCVWLWILEKEEKDKTELYQRMLEEFKGMQKMCTTGHLARLINIIQGYTNDENLMIKISEKDRLTSVIKAYLAKKLSECQDEDVVNGMIDGGESYKKYIQRVVIEILPTWKKEFAEDIESSDIASIVNSYAGCIIFSRKVGKK